MTRSVRNIGDAAGEEGSWSGKGSRRRCRVELTSTGAVDCGYNMVRPCKYVDRRRTHLVERSLETTPPFVDKSTQSCDSFLLIVRHVRNLLQVVSK